MQKFSFLFIIIPFGIAELVSFHDIAMQVRTYGDLLGS